MESDALADETETVGQTLPSQLSGRVKERSVIRPAGVTDYADFERTADDVLTVLQRGFAFDCWVVARLDGAKWTILKAVGQSPFSEGSFEAHLPAICASLVADSQAVRTSNVSRLSYAGVPITIDGMLTGLLCGFGAPATPDEKHLENLLALSARIFSSQLSYQRKTAELRRRAELAEAESVVDELTGLCNRRGWNRAVHKETSRAERYGGQTALFVMDVDGLKAINDRDGHAAGDRTLRNVADALRYATRENDIIARLGGDEFAILAVEASEDDACALHRRLEKAFAAAKLSVSIGSVHCKHRDDIARALERADNLLYAAKRARFETPHRVEDESDRRPIERVMPVRVRGWSQPVISAEPGTLE